MSTTELAPVTGQYEAVYFRIDDVCGEVVGALGDAPDAGARAVLLEALAHLQDGQAAVHLPAFGPSPIPEENGRDMAESITNAARILRALAATEQARAASGQRRHTDPVIEQHAGMCLDELVTTAGSRKRRTLYQRLWKCLEPVMGEQATEVIATVAATEQ